MLGYSIMWPPILGLMNPPIHAWQIQGGVTPTQPDSYDWEEYEFTISAPGQTVFTIPEAPTDLQGTYIILNNMLYVEGVDYTIVGTTLTWINPLSLDTSDEMIYKRIRQNTFKDESYDWKEDTFTVTSDGQTVFTISSTPMENEGTLMLVNGVVYYYGVDYTISGTTLTWISSETLQTTDEVLFRFIEKVSTPGSHDEYDWIDEALTVSIDGQTAFTLSQAPFDDESLYILVNSVSYTIGEDFTLAGGVNITWINPLTLQTTDDVRARYVIKTN